MLLSSTVIGTYVAFGRFGQWHARVLLHKQDEIIVELEQKLLMTWTETKIPHTT